jgi:sulfate adenylyltransferase
MPQHTLHGDDLAWLELQLSGLVPTGYGGFVPPLVLPSLAVEPGDSVDLLDPEGVTLAQLRVTAAERLGDRTEVQGHPEAVTPFAHPDHRDLRRPPWPGAPSLAIWGGVPSTLPFREAALRWAEARGVPLVELLGVGSGRDTDAATHLPVRLARLESTRRTDDHLVVVPFPDLGFDERGLTARAHVAAAYGVRQLLVPVDLDPVTSERIERATGVRVSLPDVAAGRALVDLDEWLGSADRDLPDWVGEPALREALREAHPARHAAGFTVLLSGLSGSGKSTVARMLAARLVEQDHRSVSLLDGDVVRHHLSKGLGFSRADRDTNVRRIGFVASEITKAGGIAVCAPIAPYDATRRDVRAMVERHGGFVLVHVATPLAECERRDRKGLYAKARRGEIPEFTGISDPYEVPGDAELTIDTTGRTVDACVADVLERLRELGFLAP